MCLARVQLESCVFPIFVYMISRGLVLVYIVQELSVVTQFVRSTDSKACDLLSTATEN